MLLKRSLQVSPGQWSYLKSRRSFSCQLCLYEKRLTFPNSPRGTVRAQGCPDGDRHIWHLCKEKQRKLDLRRLKVRQAWGPHQRWRSERCRDRERKKKKSKQESLRPEGGVNRVGGWWLPSSSFQFQLKFLCSWSLWFLCLEVCKNSYISSLPCLSGLVI